ncbi:MAG: hypothetical protein CMJ18_05780 [Phycisphaeraceae bacterium]|nr:hypothetical protein [Phycisphaeraceae bacterium]
MSERILLIGAPRSGTSWICDVLARAPGAEAVFEPDNEINSLTAVILKGHLPRFPTLDRDSDDPQYEALWQYACVGRHARNLQRSTILNLMDVFAADRDAQVRRKEALFTHLDTLAPSPGARLFARFLASRTAAAAENDAPVRLIKSVHAVFALEWLVEHVPFSKVMIVMRSPHGIIASMRRMRMADGCRLGSLHRHLSEAERRHLRDAPEGDDRSIDVMALQVSKMYQHLEDVAQRRPELGRVTHEQLCTNPLEQFRAVYEQLGLTWDEDVENAIAQHDQPGEGYKTRRSASQEIDKWRRHLSSEQIDRINRILLEHDLNQWAA